MQRFPPARQACRLPPPPSAGPDIARRSPVPPAFAAALRTALVPILAGTLALASGPESASAQSLLQRAPNLTGGWIATPGTLVLDAYIRYRSVDGFELAGVHQGIAAFRLPADLLAGPTA